MSKIVSVAQESHLARCRFSRRSHTSRTSLEREADSFLSRVRTSTTVRCGSSSCECGMRSCRPSQTDTVNTPHISLKFKSKKSSERSTTFYCSALCFSSSLRVVTVACHRVFALKTLIFLGDRFEGEALHELNSRRDGSVE